MVLHELLTRKYSISNSLYVQGWQHLDAVLLAALAIEAPTLLIGSHGTAKTLLVERLAHALGLEFRHYNASLINYDDLVGIPMPEEGQDHLHFITTPVQFGKLNLCSLMKFLVAVPTYKTNCSQSFMNGVLWA